jgi:A/G-specific adenine glycosylase
MDLGATVCTPRNPSCSECPWAKWCVALEREVQTDYPKKMPKKALPVKYAQAYVMKFGDSVWLQKRPAEGLLGGMMEVPTSDWESAMPPFSPPIDSKWKRSTAPVKHVFTHFELRLDVHTAEIDEKPNDYGDWVGRDRLPSVAIPTLFKKVLDRSSF